MLLCKIPTKFFPFVGASLDDALALWTKNKSFEGYLALPIYSFYLGGLDCQGLGYL